MLESLTVFLFLLLALAIGWGLGRWQMAKRLASQDRLAQRYFKGLNYLLNEEADKAIEIFLQLAERNASGLKRVGGQVRSDVIDTHLALGSLFRRRGEMDKAIRFHKHIIAQPHLTESQRLAALRELGRDYLQAGLLDRAERLFSELSERAHGEFQPTRQLMDIYQQEKDWTHAIEQAKQLQGDDQVDADALLAQFYCELAQQALARGDRDSVVESLRHARQQKPNHPRAYMIEAKMASLDGDVPTMIQGFIRACEADPEVFVLVRSELRQAFEKADRTEDYRDWLQGFYVHHPMTSILIEWAALEAKKSPQVGVATLLAGLEKRPTIRGLEALVDLLHSHEMTLSEVSPELVGQLMMKLKNAQARYRCKECGFSSSEHHWLCPSCRTWDSTRLIQGPWGD